jgi:hypothetical protein
MFEVKADKSKNLLIITFSLHFVPEEAKRYEDKVVTALAELETGFRLLTDLSRLDAMDLGCVPYIKKAMDLCNQKRISAIVRVIPDPQKDIGFNILSLFHYRHGVTIITCETLAEAMKSLSN